MNNATYFLHGLDSSGQGTKGRYFGTHFPWIERPDFSGSLEERLETFSRLANGKDRLTLIGSSYGGLMAAVFAIRQTRRVTRLILFAPALNYEKFTPPAKKIPTPTLLYIGKQDNVTPVDQVVPLAKKTFANMELHITNDDHMLHSTFHQLNWQKILEST